MVRVFAALISAAALTAQAPHVPPRALPAEATNLLTLSLNAARPHKPHVWRDTPAMNPDGTVNGYVEIPRGELRKFEFDIKANTRAVDRVMPASVGGYPVNYGFVPQTISYDGDPFDILVLGPALPGGELVRGAIVGVLFMEDEKGFDSKVVVSLLDAQGRPRHPLALADKTRIGSFFAKYKDHEPGKFSRVHGWGSEESGLAYVRTTHAFFRECVKAVGACVLR